MRRSVSCRSAVEPQSQAHLSFVIAGCCTRNMLQKWFCCDVDVEQLLLTNFSFLSDSGSGKTHLGDTTFPIKLQHVKKKKIVSLQECLSGCVREREELRCSDKVMHTCV